MARWNIFKAYRVHIDSEVSDLLKTWYERDLWLDCERAF